MTQAASGDGVLKYADTANELRAIANGDPSWGAMLRGLGAPGDGGGGMFFWSATAKADDGWNVLNQNAGDSAGWRRAESARVPDPGFPTGDMCTADVRVGSPINGVPGLKADGSGPAGLCVGAAPTQCSAVCSTSSCTNGCTCTNACAMCRLIALVPDRGTVCFPTPSAPYQITGEVPITHPVTLLGHGATLQATYTQSTASLLKVTGNDVHVTGLRLVGTAGSQNVNGIGAFGVGSAGQAPTFVSGLRVENTEISSSFENGIYLQYASDFTVSNNDIHDVRYGGVMVLSSTSGVISNNRIRDVEGVYSPVNGYGIALTRTSNGDFTGDPRTTDVVVSSNVIRNVKQWEALDTHCGQRITFQGNVISATRLGINVGYCSLPNETPNASPRDVAVIGNIMDATGATPPLLGGIHFVGMNTALGSSEDEHATGIIAGNILTGYGDPNNIGSGAMFIWSTEGLVLSGNLIREAAPTGIHLVNDNYDTVVTGNSIVDTWFGTGPGKSVGVYQDSGYNTGVLSGNAISREKKPAPTFGIFSRLTGTSAVLGVNHNEAVTPTYDPNGVMQTTLRPNTSISSSLSVASSVTIGSVSQGSLGTAANGTVYYCTDCKPDSSCSSGGPGALAKRLHNDWVCD